MKWRTQTLGPFSPNYVPSRLLVFRFLWATYTTNRRETKIRRKGENGFWISALLIQLWPTVDIFFKKMFSSFVYFPQFTVTIRMTSQTDDVTNERRRKRQHCIEPFACVYHLVAFDQCTNQRTFLTSPLAPMGEIRMGNVHPFVHTQRWTLSTV
jgi:hypothetical protein